MAGLNGRRKLRAAESFASAAAAIGPIERDMSVFLVTRGQFSMLDMIQHCLAELGPSRLSVWTWAIADDAGEALGTLMATSAIRDRALYKLRRLRVPACEGLW